MARIALIGCGRIGRMHADHLARHDRTELVWAVDPDAEAARAVAERHACRGAETADAALADASVDGVLVASATSTHADYIEAAVDAGKAVLCEKPVDLDLDRVNRCAAHVQGRESLIQIGFNRRFDPGHRAVRDALRAGEIGDLHQVVITSRDPEMPPRAYYESAGGLFRDMTIHDFDLARFLLDEEPVSVYATARALIDPELGAELDDADTAMLILETANGKMCHINNSRTAVYGYDQRVELMGASGMLISGNRTPHGCIRYHAGGTGLAAPYHYFFIDRYGESYRAEIDAFVRLVEEGAPPPVTLEDGRRALVLAEAAYLSLATGGRVSVADVPGA